MRLTQIKLAGFKSFVDPVSFHVPGQLVGVVGPNGCGKSNIMDATRWVLGESKASELRGESMHDVIFNGSGNRKPAARASVELVFDNTEGRAVAGQWGQYAEIAVKRVLTRDGGSSYYINNQQVRRRDVQDIFMGTGLGPRAYAIIGQGMIARIIEAKPEELRVFLEEAAGVSKYKERRRETENRLHDTRENLTRVEDILRELNSQVERLQVQAAVAQEYRELQNAAQDKLHFLWLLRADEADAERQKILLQISEANTAIEGHIAQLRLAEAELETQRARHYELSDAVHVAQGSLYEANTEVSRFEAEIKFITEGRARIQAQMEQIKTQLAQWQTRQSELDDESENLINEREAAEEAHAAQTEQLAMDSDGVPALEARHKDALAAMQSAHAQYVQVEQKVARAADDQRSADRQMAVLTQRRERLSLEKVAPGQADARELMELEHQLNDAVAMQEEAQAKLMDIDERLPQSLTALNDAREAAQTERQRIASLNARLEALTQLQEKVQAQGQLTPWLEKHQLATRQRLWQKVHIEAGWENALEAVLAERMGALELSRMDWAKGFFNDVPPAKLSFYANDTSTSNHDVAGLTSMMRMVKTQDATLQNVLPQWLSHVYVAASLDEAYGLREQLPEHGVLVTRDGHQLGKNTLRFYVAESEQAGMLARAQEIENIQTQLRAQDMLTDEVQGDLSRLQSQVDQLNAQQAQARNQSQGCTVRVHELQMQTQKVKQASEQLMARHAQISDELTEIEMQEEELLAQKMTAQALFDEGDAHLVEQQTLLQNAQDTYNDLDEQLGKMRSAHRDAENSVRDAQYRLQTLTQRLTDIEYNKTSTEQQLAFLQNSHEEQVMQLEEFADVSHHDGLQEALNLRLEREEALAEARRAADALTHELRTADEARLTLERGIEPLRAGITELQLKEQAARINQEQYDEQLKEAEVDKDALRVRLEEVMKDGTRASALQGEITRLNNQINALGPINLAALDELKTAEERQGFLNAQMADLMEAMTTLEDAIAKIDKESSDLLQATFDTVNKNFGELFPELFGGGEAKLMMTGDSILDSGVQVMAQPPGKRNSTIHLLSGGEKALTAIALVFALFKLNPAPFCLLDEVDAPLDDANTERFANLVKKMSEYTQFLFISHNKIAMEMAQQLIGVTMQEQGVSRVVAVDMESALEMAGL